MTDAIFSKFSSNEKFDVVSGVGGHQTGSTTAFND